MILNDSTTGEAIFNTTPKSLSQILTETELVYFGLFEEHMPELSLDELEDTFFPDGLTDGALIKARIDQLASGPADWVVCALTGVLFVNLAFKAARVGDWIAAWSHGASASAWVNYGKGLAVLPSATEDETLRRLAGEIEKEKQRKQTALNDARYAVEREIKSYALSQLKKGPPGGGSWNSVADATTHLFPVVIGKYRDQWKTRNPRKRLADWFYETEEVRSMFKPSNRGPKKKESK